MDGYSVGALAEIAGISVRTLHHYDEIGLLVPSHRTPAGYREYGDSDLERLQQILLYRELGFGLDDIASILADPGTAAEDHLRRQHALLRERIARHQDTVAAIERQMEARQMGVSLTPEERFEIFGPDAGKHFGGEYAQEAQQRWGSEEPYQQSRRRAALYTKQDWVQIKAEADANVAAFAATLAAGAAADTVRAMDLAEEHRQHINRWFYDCSYEIHLGLAEMYLADARFTAHYETVSPGLARYVRDAILANADRHGG